MTPPDRPLFADPRSDAVPLVKEPQQARSRRTLARILQASLDLLRTDGPDALTVTRIAKKAKSSVGSFYARFDGKEDLVRYVGEHALGEASTAWEELVGGLGTSPDTEEACDTLVRGLGEILTQGAALPLVLLDGLEETERSRMRRFEDEVASGLREFAGNDVGARVASMALTGVLSQAARDLGNEGRERLTDELVRLVAGYFGAPVPGTAASPASADDWAPGGPEAVTEQDAPSPWDRAASELIGSGVSTPTTETPERTPEPGDAVGDEITDLEAALRDLGAELDDPNPPGGEDEDEGRDEDEGESSGEADPFDVWG